MPQLGHGSKGSGGCAAGASGDGRGDQRGGVRAPLVGSQDLSGRIADDVEDAIVALREELAETGLDAGAGTIQWHLGRRGMRGVPSQATIWRVLVRRGFVVPEPRKRPKSSLRRFEAAAPNELWQADATKWVTASGPAEILTFLDDHTSRPYHPQTCGKISGSTRP